MNIEEMFDRAQIKLEDLFEQFVLENEEFITVVGLERPDILNALVIGVFFKRIHEKGKVGGGPLESIEDVERFSHNLRTSLMVAARDVIRHSVEHEVECCPQQNNN